MSNRFPDGGCALVIGAGGGIGQAMLEHLRGSGVFEKVLGLSRHSDPALDLTNEASIAEAAQHIGEFQQPLRLVFDATGFLHDDRFGPEKSLGQLDPSHMAHAFAVNAIGPALLMKHFMPLLAGDGKAVFATLSARVGSIGDNRLGGWYSYRASKAALNQFVRTASIELRRRSNHAVCVALHPGTVDTALSAPFSKAGLKVRSPAQAASEIWEILCQLASDDNGGFFDYEGKPVDW